MLKLEIRHQRDLLWWVVIVSLLIFSFGILSHHLTYTSLWADEGWTIAATTEKNPVDVVTQWVVEDVHPPLFFVELNLWRKFTGDTIFEMRYFSVLVTWVGVALMYRLGKALFSARAGILAALFFALHDLVHVLTQEVRHYPQQQTAVILALWLYWRFWRRPTQRRGFAFVLGGTALIYTHYWGGFVLMALGIHALVTRGWRWYFGIENAAQNREASVLFSAWLRVKPFVWAFLAIFLLYLPWLPTLYHQMTVERPRGLPHALDNSWIVYKTLAYQLLGTPEIFWIILACAGTVGVLGASRWQAWLPTAASGLPMLVIVLTVGLSILVNTHYNSLSFRSLAVVIPALVVLIGRALAQFRVREQFLMATFLVVHSLATTAAAPVERPPWPQLADFVAHHFTQGDVVLLEMDTDEFALAYYLDHSGAVVRHVSTENERLRLNNDVEFSAFLSETLANVDGLWIAKFGYYAYDIRNDVMAQEFVVSAPAVTDWGRYVDGRPIELLRYDRPATEVEVVFGEVMQLMRSSVSHASNEVVVNLLWSTAKKPEINYTVSTFLLADSGAAVTFHDSQPFDARSRTVDWQVGNYYFDSHALATEALPPGHYRIGVKVYHFIDTSFTQLEIDRASDCSANAQCEYVVVGEVSIE